MAPFDHKRGCTGEAVRLRCAVESRFFVILAIMSLTGCATPARSGPLINSYSHAECVPVTLDLKSGPPTRTWNYVLETHHEGAVRVLGKQMPGGLIALEYALDAKGEIAANAGDYVYPADVRVDGSSERLYVKAEGIRINQLQTWLFEYDLQHRLQTARLRVDPKVLPEECRATNSN